MAGEAREIAKAFVDARRNGAALAAYPGTPPGDLAAAYAIQDSALALWNRPIGGWKVGRINPPEDSRLGANRLAGPVFADTIQPPSGDVRHFDIFQAGFAAAEAEFMLRLAPRGTELPRTPIEAMDWIDEIRIGVEIASSPYPGINADGPCVTVSDHGNNAGLALGPIVPRTLWTQLDEIAVTVEIDGKQVGKATTATMLDGAFGAAAFLLDNLAQRGIPLAAGWWISSGAITGVHTVVPGNMVVARFSGIGEISGTVR